MVELRKRTLSTKVDIDVHKEFVNRAKELGVSPSTLLRRLVMEFLGKPLADSDRVLRLEKEVESLKSDILEIRSRIDILSRRLLLLEKRRSSFPRREKSGGQ